MNLDTLFNPYPLNDKFLLKNHIVMAPMTRNKADDHFVPTDRMAEYYAKRAQAGLIITEGTIISPEARGYSNTPALYTKEQIQGWQKVTSQVHQNNGKIFAQLWHVGRVSHPIFLQGQLPLSASKTLMTGQLKRSHDLHYGWSREATVSEIKTIIKQFAKAAENAMEAGFDGIEIHGANGYLIDQFLHYDTNQRTDTYGGSPENMARFALEIVNAVGNVIGFERTGIRLSPATYLNQIKGQKEDAEIFSYLLTQLNSLNIAYVHTGNFDDKIIYDMLNHQTMTAFMRKIFHGTLIASGSYNFAEAEEAIRGGRFDLVAIGRPFIANPDLISRLQTQQELKEYHPQMLEALD
ncbi:alkene reductase [Legionella israelensis]|uniref:Alkene reductase n=1 Tax=Legionella israelensis TaxID=454 RepID=A0AAX1EHD3_9GAMM|nr:alkene reductase [Legionella israelensis]QBR84494.1 alkene reductase [Legionella israelensis]